MPGAALNWRLRCAVPEIVGAPVLTGGAAWIIEVGALGTLTDPSGLAAVTTTRILAPSSPVPST